ncbi:polysaccharide deacetylase family protein [Kitasatospora sp. DSM 101779]|uniref:polysaccharide deacetylase family protein n=1 Tax=Kitasatospora sp. DSM 101779 TaxID=2853165 RepID=UPI0021D99D08|nr:polysaccharide deacetylase family protein [Kitasatospora sp. DSM 101779]MCU7826615.1 polysaccharide deacetylase family protein [Kitasatospora sp. DSM 101779]
MTGPARWAVAAAATAAGVEVLHLAPSVTRLPPVGRLAARRIAGHGAAGHVALTFDDGPDPGSTPDFLAALDVLGVRATFFVLGSMLECSPDLGRELVRRGHEVGVHGWHHRHPWYPRPGRDLAELRAAVAAVTEVCGVPPRWYRPPYGVLSSGLAVAAHRLGLRTVLWTACGRDWTAHASPGSVYRSLRPDLRGGATVLLHDSDCTSAPGSWRSALGALPAVADRCTALGLALGPLRDHGLAA